MADTEPFNLVLRTPHALAMGFEMVEVCADRAVVLAPWREDLVGDPDTDVIAGGVVTTLLDQACGMALYSSQGRGAGFAATLDLRIDYMRPAAPRASVTAVAHCYKLGRSIAFLRASAYDVDPENPIATAQGAFALNPAPRP